MTRVHDSGHYIPANEMFPSVNLNIFVVEFEKFIAQVKEHKKYTFDEEVKLNRTQEFWYAREIK